MALTNFNDSTVLFCTFALNTYTLILSLIVRLKWTSLIYSSWRTDWLMLTLLSLASLFQLIPGYRGYTIDSLRKLSILDDIMISADEKHHYKGLARRRGMTYIFSPDLNFDFILKQKYFGVFCLFTSMICRLHILIRCADCLPRFSM